MLSWILASLVTALLLPTCENVGVPQGYSLDEPAFNHGKIAIGLAEGGDLPNAIPSFHAACRFNNEPQPCANLGVALMRHDELGKSYNAFQEALRRDRNSKDAKENLKVLYEHAEGKNMNKKLLLEDAKKHPLNFKAPYGGGAGRKAGKRKQSQQQDEPERSWDVDKESGKGFTYDIFAGASDMDGNRAMPRRLFSPDAMVKRGRELVHRGEKKVGRAMMNMAVLLDPWLMDDKATKQAFDGEKLEYWNGNVFLGYDKTRLEQHLSALGSGRATEDQGRQMAIYVWRNLQLLDLNCCGVINLIDWLAQFTSTKGQSYIGPLLELDPAIKAAVTSSNKEVVERHLKAWVKRGRKPMPSPEITYKDHKWEWPRMRIMLPADRLPDGWMELMQAVLNYRAGDIEAARICVRASLRENAELLQITDEFMPELIYTAVPGPLVPDPGSAEAKYLIQYNPAVGLGNIAASMVSAHALAKLTGRTFLLHWNVNEVQRHAFRFKEKPGVQLVLGDAAEEAGLYHTSHKSIYFSDKMQSESMISELELLGCSDLSELEKYKVVAMSSNLYFSSFLASNPSLSKETVAPFPEQLADLLEPGPRAVKRASAFANKTEWRRAVPIVAIHVRSRSKNEDDGDWPTKETPEAQTINKLVQCVDAAVARELKGEKSFDVFVAATTEKARAAVSKAVKQRKGVREVLTLPNLERNRYTGTGAIDAMAEALLISQADVFVRLVIGTGGYSAFAHLSNALRTQNSWASFLPPPRKGSERFAPNYVVTDSCGPGSCFKVADPELRSVDISFKGAEVGKRSCGDVFSRLGMDGGVLGKCGPLEAAKSKDEL